MRLFAGIAVPQGAGNQLSELAQRARIESLRYTALENLHLTLYFLGEVQEASLPRVRTVLEQIPVTPLLVTVHRWGTFPRAGVLFAEVELTAELRELQANAAAALMPFAARPDPNSPPLGQYHPHITLARTRTSIGLGDRGMRDFREPVVFSAASIHLYQSRPTPDGSRYEVLHTVS